MPRCILILALIGCSLFAAMAQTKTAPKATPKPAPKSAKSPSNGPGDEYAVYAAAISGLYDQDRFKDRKLLIENRTVSLECGKDSCNKLDVGDGCSGMRQPGQEPEQVLPLFRNTMSLLEQETWEDFKTRNEHCGELRNDFPLQHDYLWMDDSTKQAMIGKRSAADLTQEQQATWSQPDKVFLSSPGFNASHTQALLYLGVVCNEQCTWLGYLLMGKVNGEWTAAGHYTVTGQ